MKKFLIKLALFICIPLMSWMLLEALLPITTFTHRHFEAVGFGSKIPAKTVMYPNVNSSMYAVGDLCHHTKNAVLKKEVWKTDRFGYRNDEFVEDPDVVFVGDSYFLGSSLSQDEIISNRVKAKFNNRLKVYNISPSSLTDFEILYKTGMIKKPKVIIYSIVERNVPHPVYTYAPDEKTKADDRLKDLFGKGNLNVYLDKVLKHFSIEWLRARIHDSKGYGTPGIAGSNMYFLGGTGQPYDKANLAPTVDKLISYNNYCKALGIQFIFLPMPNKETVYYDLVPFDKQPDYLFELDSLLHNANIRTINTVKVYNDYRKTHSELLYHLDDTHWTPAGTKVVAEEIAKELRSKEEYGILPNSSNKK